MLAHEPRVVDLAWPELIKGFGPDPGGPLAGPLTRNDELFQGPEDDQPDRLGLREVEQGLEHITLLGFEVILFVNPGFILGARAGARLAGRGQQARVPLGEDSLEKVACLETDKGWGRSAFEQPARIAIRWTCSPGLRGEFAFCYQVEVGRGGT